MDSSNEPDNWIPTSFPSTPEATEGDSMSSFHSAATPGSTVVDLQSDDQSFDAISRQKLNLTIHTSPRSPRIPGMSMFEEDTRSSWSVEPKPTQLRETLLEDDSRNSCDSHNYMKVVSSVLEPLPYIDNELHKSPVNKTDNISSKNNPDKSLIDWNEDSNFSDAGERDKTNSYVCKLDLNQSLDDDKDKLGADSNIDQSNPSSILNQLEGVSSSDNIDDHSHIKHVAESLNITGSSVCLSNEEQNLDSISEKLKSDTNGKILDADVNSNSSIFNSILDAESNNDRMDEDSNIDKQDVDKFDTDSNIDKQDVDKFDTDSNISKADIDSNIVKQVVDTTIDEVEVDTNIDEVNIVSNIKMLAPISNIEILTPEPKECLEPDLGNKNLKLDSNSEKSDSNSNSERLDTKSNVVKLDDDFIEKTESDLNIEKEVDNTDIKEISDDLNNEKKDDSDILKVYEDANTEKLGDDSNIEKIVDGSNVEIVKDDSNIEKDVDLGVRGFDDLNIEKLDYYSNEKSDGDPIVEKLDGASFIESFDLNSMSEKLDTDPNDIINSEKTSECNVDSTPAECHEVLMEEDSQSSVNPPEILETVTTKPEKSVWDFKKNEDINDHIMDEDSQMSTGSKKSCEKVSVSSKRPVSPTCLESKSTLLALDEESRSSIVSQKSQCSQKSSKRPRLSDEETNGNTFRPESLFEYMWPQENGEFFLLQEQICDYLNIKSFKRKYPNFTRRTVEMDEKQFLKEKGVVTEMQCDLGLMALRSDEVLELMSKDYPDHYKDYIRVLREKEKQTISEKHKEFVASNSDKTKMVDLLKKAMQSAADYNAHLNQERREERRSCMDLQTYTVHYPVKKSNKPKPNTKPGKYPVALLPGQFQDYYKEYTPTELKYLPVNTVLYGPLKELQSTKALSDGSQSDSEDSSASEGSCSSSQETADDSSSGSEKNENSKTSEKNGTSAETAYCPKVKPNAICKVCKKGAESKDGKPDELVHCSECDNSAHPSCIELTTDVVDVLKTYPWQCMDCKVCSHCSDPNDEDKMLFCDFCDRGYHTFCVGLKNLPQGKWVCRRCGSCSICGATKPGPEASKAQWLYDSTKGVVELDANHRPKIMCQSCFKKKR